MNKAQAIQSIENLIKKGDDVLKTQHVTYSDIFGKNTFVDDDKFHEFKSQLGIFLSSNVKFKSSNDEFNEKISMTTNFGIAKKYISILKALKSSIEENIILFEDNNIAEKSYENSIFIGHGRSKLWKEVALYLKDELHLSCVNYFEKKSQAGRFIGDALRDFQNETTFAIIVMTAEDETKDNTMRTRQNVVHETGFFHGKLGFEKVAILKQDGVETFSNIDGLQYIPFSGNNINQTFTELQKMLKREGVI